MQLFYWDLWLMLVYSSPCHFTLKTAICLNQIPVKCYSTWMKFKCKLSLIWNQLYVKKKKKLLLSGEWNCAKFDDGFVPTSLLFFLKGNIAFKLPRFFGVFLCSQNMTSRTLTPKKPFVDITAEFVRINYLSSLYSVFKCTLDGLTLLVLQCSGFLTPANMLRADLLTFWYLIPFTRKESQYCQIVLWKTMSCFPKRNQVWIECLKR